MSRFERCTKCREFAWLDRHVCPPVWLCRIEAPYEDDWIETRAVDAESAAAKFAENYDSEGSDYNIVRCNGDGYVILVKLSEDEQPQRFAIEAEAVPQYRARKIPA